MYVENANRAVKTGYITPNNLEQNNIMKDNKWRGLTNEKEKNLFNRAYSRT